MLEELKTQVLQANLALPQYGLVTFTWGNASSIDRESGRVVIKPSGVPYETLSEKDLVVLDVESGRVLEGDLRPSTDTPTHLEMYRNFPEMGGIVHTHSRWATVFAQAQREIPALGTTHADHFYGPVPCTRQLTDAELTGHYELETGKVIVETVDKTHPMYIPAALVASHGPFTWGADAVQAAKHAAVLEEVACMAVQTLLLQPGITPIQPALLDRHYLRKFGINASYGQE